MNMKKPLKDVAVFAGCIAAILGLGYIEVKLEEEKDFRYLMNSIPSSIEANRAMRRLQEKRRKEVLEQLAKESEKSEEEA